MTIVNRGARTIRSMIAQGLQCVVLGATLGFASPPLTSAATITVSSPNSAVNWGIGSTQAIKWSHTMGAGTFVRLEKLTLDANGAIISTELIATSVANGSSSGTYSWIVTGPENARVRIRVTATDDSATDVSNVNFTIAAAFVRLTSPSTGSSWPIGSVQRQSYSTNLGSAAMLRVVLSTDGGSTFPTVLGSSPATKPLNFTVPNSPTTTARVRAIWINPPAGASAEGTNPGNFRIEAPYLTLTSPNGGELWYAGTKQSIKYQTNLPPPFKLELSLDNGGTYPVLLASQFSGTFNIVADASWESDTARVRISTVGGIAAQDTSNQSFRIVKELLLQDGGLSVAVRADNGAIRGVAFNGIDVYFPGTPVSDYGFQLSTDTTTFKLNNTRGRTDLPVTIFEDTGSITASGIYVAGTTQIDFQRRYELLAGLNVLRVTTSLTNYGPEVVLSCFDTFDPDQGDMRGWGRGTYNDVYVLDEAAVARATDRGGWTIVMGTREAGVTLGAGSPFWIDRGTTLNGFFSAPYDGNGSFADSGFHVGKRLALPQGVTLTFVFDQAFGTSLAAAEAAFLAANPR